MIPLRESVLLSPSLVPISQALIHDLDADGTTRVLTRSSIPRERGCGIVDEWRRACQVFVDEVHAFDRA
jgi:hypothetical protein